MFLVRLGWRDGDHVHLVTSLAPNLPLEALAIRYSVRVEVHWAARGHLPRSLEPSTFVRQSEK